jgi:hypothetical protein
MDECGNSSTCSQTIYVNDNIMPELQNVPADITGDCGEIPSPAIVTATDNCDVDVFVDFDEEVISTGCPATVQRTWTAYDDCGNTDVAIQYISFNDEINPEFTFCPEGGDLGCNPEGVPAAGQAVATDNCGTPSITSSLGEVEADGCSYSQTRTYTATDACGNEAYCYQTFTWTVDTEEPQFTFCPAGGDLGCNPEGVPAAGQATATDNCGTPSITSSLGEVEADGCSYSQTRTYTATDACGNEAYCYQTFTWTVDTEEPQFTFCPAGGDLGCNPEGVPAAGQAVATDNCGTPSITSSLGEVEADGCYYSQTRTYTATDACGNQAYCYQTFTWKVDTEEPSFEGCPSQTAPAIYTCLDEVPAPATVTAFDNCDGEITPEFSETQTNPGSSCNNTIVRTWTAMDECGNSSTCSQTIYVNDNVLPSIVCPSDVFVECTDEVPAADINSVIAEDNCSEVTVVHVGDNSTAGECVNRYVIERVYSATDICGNVAYCTQIIGVSDNSAPEFIFVPSDVTSCGQVADDQEPAIAEDNCGGEVFISFVDSVDCGQYTTYTIGGWGSPSNSGPGSYRDANFESAFGDNLTIGCETGSYTFTSAQAIEEFLPAGGTPSVLPEGNVVNPTEVSNTLASQLLAATLNVGFDNYDADFGDAPGNLEDMIFVSGTFAGMSINEVIVIANEVIGGCSNAYSPSDLNDALTMINEGYDEGTVNTGDFTCEDGGQNNSVCDYPVIRIWSATDDCGNVATVEQLISIPDTEAPVATYVPADALIECGDELPIDEPTFEDNCSEQVSITEVLDTTSNDCGYTIHRAWRATDDCGNFVIVMQHITVTDTQAPYTASEDQEITLECGSQIPVFSPVFEDTCDDSLQVYAISGIGYVGCNQVISEVYYAEDDCGNVGSVSRTITFVDTTPPVLSGVPANVSAQCGQVPPVAEVTAEDICDGEIEVEYSEDSEQDGCYNNITRTWTATDACGNSVSASQTIVVGDNEDPYVVSAPAEEIWVECDQNVPPLEVTFGDNCDEELTIEQISAIAPSECGYQISRSVIATDDCGNSTSFGQIVNVVDTTNPVIVWSPADINIECDDEIPAAEEPIFSDNCDEDLIILPASSIVQLECGYAIHRSWTATDDCGNSVTAMQNITVVDNVAPVVDPYTVYQQVDCEDLEDFEGITATDNCSEVTITFETDTFSGGCPGVIVRTYTISDECGNSTTAQQILSIQDTNGPVILNPENATVECDNAPTEMPEILIYDACGLEVTILEASQEIVPIDECTYQIIWHWEAMDYCENLSEATTVITVTDTTSPEFSNMPENMSYSCEETFEAPIAPTVTDNCDEEVEVVYSVDTIPGACPQSFDIIFTWRAYDNCENETIESVVYQIRDFDAPVFVSEEDEFSYECDENIAVVQPVAIDNCGEVSYDYSDSNPWNDGCSYGFSRVWTATDECGNSSVFIQSISVHDTTAPIIDGDYEIEVSCELLNAVYITATDNCTDVEISYTDTEVSGACAGRYIRDYVVTDECGNESTFEQIITLIDETNPVVLNPAEDLTVECGEDYESYEPIFTDNCDTDLEITAISSISTSEDGCTTYISQSWTATDNCNNTVTASRTITIVDTTAPTFDSTPEDQWISCDEVAAIAEVTASDICDEDVEVSHEDTIEEGDCPAEYTIVRTWTATDECGNAAEYVQHIYVTDNNLPYFVSVPEGGSYSCEDQFDFGSAVADDACSTVEVSYNDEYDYSCENTYTIVRTWTAEDACGNVAYAYTTYSVYDNTQPQFTTEFADVYVECASEIPSPAAAEATDNCSNVDIDVDVITINSDECGNQTLYVQYTATDACDNINYAGYYIFVLDETEPVFVNCPSDLVLDCDAEIPAAIAPEVMDNCDNDVDVTFEQFILGETPAEGSIADCDLITPIRPAGNPCGYPYDWAMALFNLPTSHRYYSISNGNLVQYPNGSVHVTGELHNAQNPNNGWNIDVWFNNGMNWEDWSSQAFPTSFKADCGGEAANHIDWTYFLLQSTEGAELTGFGAYAGSSLSLVHAPANNYFGFQLGNGANNYNGADNGFGGWFSYNGYFQINQTPYGNNQGSINGAGDLAFELDCCPDYEIVRQWTATDCSGNSTTCSQSITFGDLGNDLPGVVQVPGNGKEQADNLLEVAVAPNPANESTIFTFVAAENAPLTIRIMDIAGKLLLNTYNTEVEAGIEYKVNMNVQSLSTGVYMYQVENGSNTQTGRLMISK